MIEINLLPGGSHQVGLRRAATMDVGEAFRGFTGRFRDMYLIAAIAAVVITVGSIALRHHHQEVRHAAIIEQERLAILDSTHFVTVLRARRRAEAKRDSVYEQVAIVKSIDDHRYIWPHLLEEISRALPPYTWLTAISQTSAPPNAAVADSEPNTTKGKVDTSKTAKAKAAGMRKAHLDSLLIAAGSGIRFHIVGQTVDVQALTEFMKMLEASPFIHHVQLTRSDLVVLNAKEVTEFQLEGESEIPPPMFLKMVQVTWGKE